MLGIIVGVIIGVLFTIMGEKWADKREIKNIKANIAKNIERIQSEFPSENLEQDTLLTEELTNRIREHQQAALEACDYWERVNASRNYRQYWRHNKLEEFQKIIYSDIENEVKYQESMLKVYDTIDNKISIFETTNDTIIRGFMTSGMVEGLSKRDRSSLRQLEQCQDQIREALKGDDKNGLEEAVRIRKQRDNDIDILRFDEQLFRIIIVYDSMLRTVNVPKPKMPTATFRATYRYNENGELEKVDDTVFWNED